MDQIQEYFVEYQCQEDRFYSEFTKTILSNSLDYRNIAIIGPYHSGKTFFLDMLIRGEESFKVKSKNRLSDFWLREKKSKMTLLAKPCLINLPDEKGKTSSFNILDCPGHPDFFNDVLSSLSLVDFVILVVDSLEGVSCVVEELLREIQQRKLGFILVMNKIDWFIVEMRISPEDCYLKLHETISHLKKIQEDVLDRTFFCSSKYYFLFPLQ